MEIKDKILEMINAPDYLPLSPEAFLSFFESEATKEEIARALLTLEEEFEIVLSKKRKVMSASSTGVFRGTYSASAKGDFGFVDTETESYFIPPNFTIGAWHGDTVAIRRFDSTSRFFGKGNEAEIIGIIHRNLREFCGTLRFSYLHGKYKVATVLPDSEKIKGRFSLALKDCGSAQEGDKVFCRIVSYPSDSFSSAKVQVEKVLGKSQSKEANYRAILLEHGIVTEFDEKVLSEADEVAKEEISQNGRLDLRDKTVFTLDSASAKDLDDAISVEETENGYRVGVHIADVSHYVKENSFLDQEAMERGTSVYFTDKVVPMLPPALSNGACSLNGGVDRYALSAFMTIDRNGELLQTEIFPSVICSKVRGVYAEVNDVLEKNEQSEFYEKYRHVLPDFMKMMDVYRILKAKSVKKGALDLEGEDVQIILDETGFPVDICKRERGESEKLIEQFMLLANEGVASFLHEANMPCVYRVHGEPDQDKMDGFILFAKNLGVDVSSLRGKKITPKGLCLTLESAKEKGVFDIVSSVLLRSLMKASYSAEQKEHFGLATDCYCHFTSPIRRYPDLSVHRILHRVLDGTMDENTIAKYENFAKKSAVNSSENELRSLYAEREIEDLYKTLYLSDKVGQTFSCVICSVGNFGFFARTQNLCEGIVPKETIGERFVFDEVNKVLSCGKTVYRLGQSVDLILKDVDVISRRAEFCFSLKDFNLSAPKKKKYGKKSGKNNPSFSKNGHKKQKNRKKSKKF